MKATTQKLFAGTAPAFHHLDRRAHQIIATADGPDDELLTTKQVADWFGVSVQWLEIGRSSGYGPEFERLSPRMIRYRRGAGRAWLHARAHASTAEYRRSNAGKPLDDKLRTDGTRTAITGGSHRGRSLLDDRLLERQRKKKSRNKRAEQLLGAPSSRRGASRGVQRR